MTAGPFRRLLGLARRAADPADDEQLLARFAADGEPDAFELLVWRHAGMVLGVCRRVLGDHHAAEDAFQATFLALARQAGSVRGCVPAWLHRVARRTAMRARMDEHRAVSPTCRDDRQNHVALTPRRSPEEPIEAAARRELRDVLDEELDRLPERYRRPVVMCYLEGTSTAEAARRLGCPRGTVLSRLAAARAKLRVRLTRRGVTPTAGGLAVAVATSESPAALVAPAVRAAVAGPAAPRVIDLCDGVLRAMTLSKLKLTAAVLLTVGLAGGGFGWVVLPPGGPGVALADGPPAKPAAKPDDRQAADQLRAELDKAEVELTDNERRWQQERARARDERIEAEEKLRQLDREQAFKLGLVRSRLQDAEAKVPALSATLRNQVRLLGKDHPEVASNQAAIRDLEAELDRARKDYEQLDAEFTKRMIEARKAVAQAEDRMQTVEQLQAIRRRHLQVHRDALLAHVLQQHGLSGRPDGDRLSEIDRKLDDVKREFAEMRRELKK